MTLFLRLPAIDWRFIMQFHVEKTLVHRNESWEKRIMGLPKRLRQQEPSSDLRGFLATLCSPALGLQVKSCFRNFSVSLPINSIRFLRTTETRMIAQAPCIRTGMKKAVCRLQDPLTFLTGQRPVLQYQLFFE